MKLNKHVAGVLNVINKMQSGLDNCEDDMAMDEFYNTKFKIAFGDAEAEFYCCASIYNCFENVLGKLLRAVIEEEELVDIEPYKSLYNQYEKFDKW